MRFDHRRPVCWEIPAAVLGHPVAVGYVLGPAAGRRETERLRDVLGQRGTVVTTERPP